MIRKYILSLIAAAAVSTVALADDDVRRVEVSDDGGRVVVRDDHHHHHHHHRNWHNRDVSWHNDYNYYAPVNSSTKPAVAARLQGEGADISYSTFASDNCECETACNECDNMDSVQPENVSYDTYQPE